MACGRFSICNLRTLEEIIRHMRSMTGYGRGQSSFGGAKFSVELNAVNRKQSDVTVSLPREFNKLEPRVRDLINARISRGRLNVVVSYQNGAAAAPRLWPSMPPSPPPIIRPCGICRRT